MQFSPVPVRVSSLTRVALSSVSPPSHDSHVNTSATLQVMTTVLLARAMQEKSTVPEELRHIVDSFAQCSKLDHVNANSAQKDDTSIESRLQEEHAPAPDKGVCNIASGLRYECGEEFAALSDDWRKSQYRFGTLSPELVDALFANDSNIEWDGTGSEEMTRRDEILGSNHGQTARGGHKNALIGVLGTVNVDDIGIADVEDPIEEGNGTGRAMDGDQDMESRPGKETTDPEISKPIATCHEQGLLEPRNMEMIGDKQVKKQRARRGRGAKDSNRPHKRVHRLRQGGSNSGSGSTGNAMNTPVATLRYGKGRKGVPGSGDGCSAGGTGNVNMI